MDAETNARSTEDRLRAVEDWLEVCNLIASHPPCADTGAAEYARAMFVEVGILDLGADKLAVGNNNVGAILASSGHQAAIAGGLAHFSGLPQIALAATRRWSRPTCRS
jgi:hypothetical protein